MRLNHQAGGKAYLAESNGHIYAVVMYGIQDVQGFFVYTIENSELTLVEQTEYTPVSDQYRENESNRNLTDKLRYTVDEVRQQLMAR